MIFNKTDFHCWEVDLEQEKYINALQIKWESYEGVKYIIEVSLDSVNWIRATDILEYTAISEETKDIINTKVRYLRVTLTGDNLKEGKVSFRQMNLIIGQVPEFVNGVDISHLPQLEDFGGKFYNRQGEEQPCEVIFKNNGVNYIRLKVWNKPCLPLSDPAGYNDKKHVLKMAKRVKNQGFKLLIDFHYSDWWTDPGKQFIPEAWKNLSFDKLRSALYDYTFEVISDLKTQGTIPEMVQVGNEITNGMMWDVAKVSEEFDTPKQWEKLCELLKRGLCAVKAVDNSIKTIIHIERGGDNERSRYFYDKLEEYKVDYDIIGLSYYPIWHGNISDFRFNVNDLAQRYNRGIIVVETAFPYTTEVGDDTPNASSFSFSKIPEDYQATLYGQASIIQAIISILKKLPEGKGMGYFYWQPDFIPVKGAGWKYGAGCEWDDQTLFDFKGKELWSQDIFKMHS